MRTQVEIDAEIAKLEPMIDKIRPRDAFGGDNRMKARLELRTLKGQLTREDANDRDDPDERSSIDFALDWMEGDNDGGSPSENWAPLVEESE